MGFETISAKELENFIGRDGVIIVDLRDNIDYEKGHVPTASNIPYDLLEQNKFKLYYFYSNLLQHEIVLYCDRVGVSLLACRELYKMGYKVYNVYGGFLSYRGTIEKGEL